MKLKLRIEDLSVESFEAASAPAALRGTVRANDSDPNSCFPWICVSNPATCPLVLTCGGGTEDAHCSPDES